MILKVKPTHVSKILVKQVDPKSTTTATISSEEAQMTAADYTEEQNVRAFSVIVEQ